VKFLFLIQSDENAILGIKPEEIHGWFRMIEERGSRVVGGPLQHSDQAKRVEVRGGKPLITDGPFAEAKEVIGGFDLIECSSLEDAVELAVLHPVAAKGSVVVRPMIED
jgi:hypothetical protein